MKIQVILGNWCLVKCVIFLVILKLPVSLSVSVQSISVGWGVDQSVGGFGDEPGVKVQLMNLVRSVRTVMRGDCPHELCTLTMVKMCGLTASDCKNVSLCLALQCRS